MRAGICYIVGAGENYGLDFSPRPHDMVIAADAGLRYLEQACIGSDLVIGDFDSLQHIPRHPNVRKLEAEKDDTDMMAAVREGMKLGYGRFHIYCGMGGRIDHTLANLQLLAFLSQSGKRGFLFDKANVITAITDQTLAFREIASGVISIFSCTDKSTGVTLQGLKYELNNAVLTNTFPLGVSNEFTGQESAVTVKDGTLLIVMPQEAKEKIVE
ncbi:MAG: thiamine diphosphokinase [Candidatus Gastranaerophilaceae bacterium]|nr:thiamine diphosphokinase [Christensenellales bacterium]